MKIIAFFIMMLFIICGCEDGVSVEEQRTERFSCKLDGKLWVADSDSEFLTGYKGVDVTYIVSERGQNEPQRTFNIYSSNISNEFPNEAKISSILMECDSLYGFNLETPINGRVRIYTDYDNSDSDWIEYTITEGFLTIKKIDTATFMAQGDFEFTAYNKEVNQTVKVTEGRFNTKYVR
jgi:hypothetical protein